MACILCTSWIGIVWSLVDSGPPPARHQVMDLVELTPLRNTLVGLPGASGLSVEQRKRLTIAVELVPYFSIRALAIRPLVQCYVHRKAGAAVRRSC